MAEKKMTRKEALTIAIEGVENEEAREVLQKMYDQVTKPRTRKPNTEKRDANNALGEQFAANFDGETFKAADVQGYGLGRSPHHGEGQGVHPRLVSTKTE